VIVGVLAEKTRKRLMERVEEEGKKKGGERNIGDAEERLWEDQGERREERRGWNE
jgi:hypothetical protein